MGTPFRDALGNIFEIDLLTGSHPAFPIRDAEGRIVVVPASSGGPNLANITESVQRRRIETWPGYSLVDDAGAGTLFARFGATGAVVADLTTGYIGGRSLKVTTDGTANYTDVRATLAAPLNMNDRHLAFAIRCADASKIEELQLSVFSGGAFTAGWRWQAIEGNQGNKWLTDGEWQIMSLAWGDSDTNVAAGFNRAAVTGIQLRVRSSGLGATDIFFGGVFTRNNRDRATCTVSFDDGYESVYTRAWPEMLSRGIKSTLYVPAEYVGAAGRLKLWQIREMLATGLVEIGYHGTGNDQRALTQLQVRELIEKDLLRWKNWGIAIRSAAYPGGEDDLTTDGVKLRNIYADYFESARMIFQGQGETLPVPSDRLRLRVSHYITNAVTTSTAGALATKSYNNHCWVHQVYHDIVASGASQTTEYNLADFATNMQSLYLLTGMGQPFRFATVTEALEG